MKKETIQNDMNDLNQVMVFKKPSQFKETWRRIKKNKLAMWGLVIMTIILLVTIAADLIVPYNAGILQNIKEKLQGPSWQHIFGTDFLGRDLFARCLHGGRVSLAVSFGASIISLLIGGMLGAMVGYFGGKFDTIVMRIMDLFSSIPSILLALAIVATLGSGLVNIGIALIVTSVPLYVRVIRSTVLGVADMEYVEAARAGGMSRMGIIMRHIIPNSAASLIVGVTMNVGQLIIATASLSFLGMGVNAPQPEWGALLSEAREYLRISPYLMVFPGVLICISSFAMNVVGDGLRDALDPRLRT